jgi:hypothetical protein
MTGFHKALRVASFLALSGSSAGAVVAGCVVAALSVVVSSILTPSLILHLRLDAPNVAFGYIVFINAALPTDVTSLFCVIQLYRYVMSHRTVGTRHKYP